MSRELGVIIKTVLEINEADARAKINAAKKKLEANNSISLSVDFSKESTMQNYRALIASLNSMYKAPPVKIVVGVNRGESMKILNKYITDAKNLVDRKFVNATIAPSGRSGNSRGGVSVGTTGSTGASISGKPYKSVPIGARYASEFENQLHGWAGKFKRGTEYRASSTTYDPQSGIYSANVQYDGSLGRTTSMLLQMDEATHQIVIKQTKLIENSKAYNKTLEASTSYIEQQRSAYENLWSKAYNQKKPIDEAHNAELSNAFTELDSAIRDAERKRSPLEKSDRTGIATLRENVKRIMQEAKSAQYVGTDLAEKDISIQKGTFATKLDTRIDELKRLGLYTDDVSKKFNKLKIAAESAADSGDFAKMTQRLASVNAEVEQVQKSVAYRAGREAQSIGSNQIGSIDTYLSNPTISNASTDGISAMRNNLIALKASYAQAQTALLSDNMTDEQFAIIAGNVRELDVQLRNVSKTADLFNGTIKSNTALDVASQKLQKLRYDFANMKREWSKASTIPGLSSQMLDFSNALENADPANINQLQKQFSTLKSNIRAAGGDMRSLADQTKNMFSKFTGWFGVSQIVMAATRSIGQMIQNVKNLDAAMVELRKVTDLTDASYSKFLQSAMDRAGKLGTTITEYVQSTSDFARLGYNIKDAQVLSEIANIYYRVGDGISDVGEASQSIISTMKAFGVEAGNAMSIVDIFNRIGNEFAVSSGDVGKAMQTAGAALASSNNSLEQSVALWTALNEILQDGDVAATSIKFITQRMRNTAGELTEMGEDATGAAESVTRLQQQILSLSGVNIMADADTFRSTYDVLKDISVVWGTLTDKNRADITRLLAGTRQASSFNAIMTNFEQADKALLAAQGAAGSATAEHDKWLNSIAAAEASATAAFEEFSSKVVNSDLVKFYYNAKTGILGFLTDVIDKIGAIPSLLTIASGALSLAGRGIFTSSTQNGTGAGNMLGLFGRSFSQISEYGLNGAFGGVQTNVIDAFNKSIGEGNADAYAVATKGVKNLTFATDELLKTSEGAPITFEATSEQIKKYGTVSKAAAIGTKLLSAAMSMVAMAAVSFVISKVVEGIDDLIHRQERLDEAAEKSAQAYIDARDEIVSLNSELDSTRSKIDALDGKSLTIVEQDELEILRETNAELERQIAAKQALADIAQRQAVSDVISAYKNKGGVTYTRSYQDGGYNGETELSGFGTDSEFIDRLVNEYAETSISDLGDSGVYTESKRVSFSDLPNMYTEIWNQYKKEYDDAVLYGDESAIASIEVNLTKYRDRIADLYTWYEDTLNGMERISNPQTESEIAYNQMFDTRDLLEIAVIQSSGQNVAQYLIDTVKTRFKDEWGNIIKYVADNGSIDANAISSMFPNIAEIFSTMGYDIADVATLIMSELKVASDAASATVSGLASSVYTATSAYESLKTAIDEQNSSGRVSVSTYQSLIEENAELASLFEQTADGYRMDEAALNDYIKAQDEFIKLKIAKEIMDLNEQLANTSDAAERSALMAQIEGYGTLAAEIDSATGAYKRWIDAQKSPDQDTVYKAGIDMAQAIRDGIESGKVGTDNFKSASSFMFGDDWESEYEKDAEKAIERARAIADRYYGEDEKVSMSNFISDLTSGGFLDADGALAAGTTLESVADKLGMSRDSVRAIFENLQTYGFDIDFSAAEVDVLEFNEQVQSLINEADALNRKRIQLPVDSDEYKSAQEQIAVITERLRELGVEYEWFQTGGRKIQLQKPDANTGGVDDTGLGNETINAEIVLDDTSARASLREFEADAGKPIVKTIGVKYTQIGKPNEYASGTSHADPGISLVDEHGAELIEHTKQGTYELGTNDGARFVDLHAGDVVHTAQDTKKILSRMSRIGSFFRDGFNKGKASLGMAFGGGKQDNDYTIQTKVSGNLDAKDIFKSTKAPNTSKATNWKSYIEKLFDWIEVHLDRLKRKTDEWIQNATEAIGYAAKNAELSKAMDSVQKQIEATTAGYARYMQEADTIAKMQGLSSDIVSNIQNGVIDISSYDDDMQNKIKAYQEWYNKALECKDAIVDLREQEQDLAKQKLDSILQHYEWRTDRLDAIVSRGEAINELKSATGVAIRESDYADALVATAQKVKELTDSRSALSAEFTSLISNGYIVEGSEAWNDYTSELESLDDTIIETQTDLSELQDTANNVAVTNLNNILKALQSIADEREEMMSLHKAQDIDNTPDDYDALIRNGMQQINNLKAQNAEYAKQQEGLEVLSEKYVDLQSKIDENNQSILDMKTSQEEWNDAVLDLRINELKKYSDELSKINDNYQKQKELQQTIEDLERARTQRTIRTYVDGVGFVYQADQSALREAQDNLEQVLHDHTIDKLDEIIQAIEDYKSDTNVYDSNGYLLGSEYNIPTIPNYASLLNPYQGGSVITTAMQEVSNAINEKIASIVTSAGKSTSVSFDGDINVYGVDDASGLAEAIRTQLPSALLQELYRK